MVNFYLINNKGSDLLNNKRKISLIASEILKPKDLSQRKIEYRTLIYLRFRPYFTSVSFNNFFYGR